MDATAGLGPVPEGYTATRVLAEDGLGRLLLCTGPSGGEVVVRVLGGASVPAAAAIAGTHECLVPVTRVWLDPQAGACIEQPHMTGGILQGIVDPESIVVGTLRLAAALAHLHGRGLLHCDVRPGAVRIDGDGNWRLADAGLAHELGKVPVEPAYAARELRGWESPGPAADVYGLGATVHAALTGSPPRAGVVTDLPSGTPSAVDELLPRMLADDPADRPGLAEIEQVLRPLAAKDAPIPALPARRPMPSAPRPRVLGLTEVELPAAAKRRGTLIGAGVAALFLIGAVGVVAANGDSDEAPTQVAQTSTSVPDASASPTAAPSSASAGEPTPKRGTPRFATGPAVIQGLTPYRISVFVYRGRLTALMEMKKISADLKELRVYSADPDGSKRRPGDDKFKELQRYDYAKNIVFFFDENVSTRRCVAVEPIRRRGTEFTDPRVVCVQRPTDRDFTGEPCLAELPGGRAGRDVREEDFGQAGPQGLTLRQAGPTPAA